MWCNVTALSDKMDKRRASDEGDVGKGLKEEGAALWIFAGTDLTHPLPSACYACAPGASCHPSTGSTVTS